MLLNAITSQCLLKPAFKTNHKYFIPYDENMMGFQLTQKTPHTHGNFLLTSLWKETVAQNLDTCVYRSWYA